MLGQLATFRRRLLKWYATHQRIMPWRAPPGGVPNPYHVLVSEIMLQQTQVVTVIPYFHRFIEEFPTLAELARAPEQRVLQKWQGLGYYRRARQLHAAARAVVRDYAGNLPEDPARLLELPGIGPYTAGAVASIAMGRRAPILDGNVARVICRLDAITAEPRSGAINSRLWARADQLLPLRDSLAGDFNAALMDLGATVCTPRSPRCGDCPVRPHCIAFASSLQNEIPMRKKSKPLPLHHRVTFCIRRGRRWLLEQRPLDGRWPGLWQFPTLEALSSSQRLTKIADISHTLTHRRYRFEVFVTRAPYTIELRRRPRRWVNLDQIVEFPLPRPHVKIAQLLQEAEAAGG